MYTLKYTNELEKKNFLWINYALVCALKSFVPCGRGNAIIKSSHIFSSSHDTR